MLLLRSILDILMVLHVEIQLFKGADSGAKQEKEKLKRN